jgi:hypothetical protein
MSEGAGRLNKTHSRTILPNGEVIGSIADLKEKSSNALH